MKFTPFKLNIQSAKYAYTSLTVKRSEYILAGTASILCLFNNFNKSEKAYCLACEISFFKLGVIQWL